MLLKRLLGSYISLLILPTQTYANKDDDFVLQKNLLSKICKKHNVNVKAFKVDTKSSSISSTKNSTDKVSVYEFEKRDKNKDLKDKKVIIYSTGTKCVAENNFLSYIRDAEKYPDTLVVGFNYRNSMKRKWKGDLVQDWVNDAVSVVNYYKSLGVAAENILLNGHCFGGGIVALAAAKIYNDEKKKIAQGADANSVKSVKLICNRSFTSLTDQYVDKYFRLSLKILGPTIFVVGAGLGGLFFLYPVLAIPSQICLGIGGIVSIVSYSTKAANFLLKPLLKLFFKVTVGNIDVLEAYKSLPEDSKDYIFVKNDETLAKTANLHYGLKPIYLLKKRQLLSEIKSGNNSFAKEELLRLKDRKVKGYIHEHKVSLSKLTTYHKYRSQQEGDLLPEQISGQEVMDNKISRLLKI